MKTIKLNENKLRSIIRESVKKVINEQNAYDDVMNALQGLINSIGPDYKKKETIEHVKDELEDCFNNGEEGLTPGEFAGMADDYNDWKRDESLM